MKALKIIGVVVIVLIAIGAPRFELGTSSPPD